KRKHPDPDGAGESRASAGHVIEGDGEKKVAEGEGSKGEQAAREIGQADLPLDATDAVVDDGGELGGFGRSRFDGSAHRGLRGVHPILTRCPNRRERRTQTRGVDLADFSRLADFAEKTNENTNKR